MRAISLRRLTCVAVVAVCCGLLAACGSSDESGGKEFSGRTLTVVGPGGNFQKAMEDAYFTPFSKATGATVKYTGIDVGTVPALVKSGVSAGRTPFDMYVSLQADVHHALGAQDLLEKVDLSQFPDLKSISDSYHDDYGLVTDVDAMVGAYNADGDAPALETTSDFFDADGFPGTRAVAAAGSGEASGMCVLALIADGVPADQLVPVDIPRCLSVWDRVRSSIKQYWSTGTQSAGFMVSGDVDYCLCYDGRMQQAKGIAQGVTYSLEGATVVPGWAGIPKGGKNTDAATALMGYMLDPKNEAVFTKGIGYAAPNPESAKSLPDSFKETLTTSPENAAKLTILTVDQLTELAKQSTELNKAWDKWINNG